MQHFGRRSDPRADEDGVRTANVSFPLTPALSLGERENRRQAGREPITARPAEALERIPPLPEGEGRGEGEQDATYPRSPDHYRNRQTLGVSPAESEVS